MDFLKLVIVSCISFVILVDGTPVQRLCPVGQYLDDSSGSCHDCMDVCKQDTKICHMLCPGYRSPSRTSVKSSDELCPDGTYLDKKILRCESCASLCDHSQLQGTEEHCRKNCPGFLDQVIPAETRHPLGHVLWSLVAILSFILVVLVAVIIVRYSGICPTRLSQSRSQISKGTMPFIVPYLQLKEEKPQQRVDQWLTLLHASDPDPDSCTASHIYNPVTSKT